jgi:hypothetical protein
LAGRIEAAHPPVRALPRHSEFLGHMRNRATLDTNPVHEQTSTMNGQSSISVKHEDLLEGEDGYLHYARRSSLDQLPGRRVTNVSIQYS